MQQQLQRLKRKIDLKIEAFLRLFYPALCQLCKRSLADLQDGFICKKCLHEKGALKPHLPPYCDKCGYPFAGNISVSFICSNCRDLNLHFEQARSAIIATDLVLDLLHRYKYQGQLWIEFLFKRLWLNWIDIPKGFDAIVPVPLHAVRLRERGFNQSERLARWLGQKYRLPVYPKALVRSQYTISQTQLNRDIRFKNVNGVFVPGPQIEKLYGLSVILVDDVLTTGATCRSCAKVLLDHGVKRVIVRTLARSV